MKNLVNTHIPDDSFVCDLFMDQVGLGCVTAADEMNIFDAMGSQEVSSDKLAEKLNIDPSAIDGLLRVLVSMGFILKTEGLFELTDVSKAYFLKESQVYRGYQFFGSREAWAHKKIMTLLKEGWSPIAQDNTSFTEMWEKGSLSQDAADRFTSMMHTNISGPATAIAKSGIFDDSKHIADVGGGSGVFLAALAQNYSDKKLTLLELPQVCQSAEKILGKYIDTSLIQFHGVNFFENDWRLSVDSIFMSNILHDWPYEKGSVILKNAYSSLEEGGAIFISECLLNEDKVSPKHTVIFDLMMYMNHRAHQYTKSELSSALMEVGFKEPTVVFNQGYYSVVKATK